MSVINPVPTAGYIYEVGATPGTINFVAPLITNLTDFPSSFSGAATASLVVNAAATGVELQLNDAYAKVLNTNVAVTPANNAVTEIAWTTQTAGSLVMSNSNKDINISRTGYYVLAATIALTTAPVNMSAPNSNVAICVSDGAGNVTTQLLAQDFYGTQAASVSGICKLTSGQTIGVFLTNKSGSTVTTGTVVNTSFSCKLIS